MGKSGGLYWLICAVLPAALSALNCTGPEGPPGEDAVGVDTVPPTIILTYPAAGDTIPDTLQALAQAVDNGVIEHVAFYFDGSDQVNDSVAAWATEPPYTFEFILSSMRVRAGLHTVSARAYDLAENAASTPPILVYYPGPPDTGAVTLRYWEADSLAYWQFPNRDEINPTTILDSLYNVRFEPAYRCRLDSFRVYLDSIPDVEMSYDSALKFILYQSNGAFPTNTVVTISLDESQIGPDGWLTTAFPLDPPFESDQPFHIGLTVENAGENTLMAVRMQVRDAYDLPIQNHSGFYSATEQRFVTNQEVNAANGLDEAYEFLLDAYIYYLRD